MYIFSFCLWIVANINLIAIFILTAACIIVNTSVTVIIIAFILFSHRFCCNIINKTNLNRSLFYLQLFTIISFLPLYSTFLSSVVWLKKKKSPPTIKDNNILNTNEGNMNHIRFETGTRSPKMMSLDSYKCWSKETGSVPSVATATVATVPSACYFFVLRLLWLYFYC